MPELPEVDAVARRVHEWAAGRTILRANFAKPHTTRPHTGQAVARRLAGRTITGVTRRAKNVLIALSDGNTLRVHLGMSGNLWVDVPGNRSASARAWFVLDDERELVFDDARLFGRMSVLSRAELAALDQTYGVEPLSSEFTVARLAGLAAGRRTPVKIFLLDQRFIAGLGNIWAAEALFAARLHPTRAMSSLKPRAVRALHGGIQAVLAHALESAYREYSAPRMTPESEGFGVAVYNRAGQPCVRCRRPIQRIPQGGRSTYFCASCQR